MGLTSAPLEAWYLAWVAIAPLWILIHRVPPNSSTIFAKQPWATLKNFWRRYQNPLIFSLAWGVGYQGLTLFWITGIHPMTWMGVPWFWSLCIAAIAWLIITIWGMGIPLLWTVGMILFRELSPAVSLGWTGKLRRLVYGTALWCVLEYLWSQGDLFWHFLAFSQSPHNLAILQLSKWSGFTTVSMVILLVNGCLAEFWIDFFSPSRKQTSAKLFLILGIIFFVGFHLLGWNILVTATTTTDQPAKIGIIQGNIPNDIKLYEEGTTGAIANYTKGYQTLAKDSPNLIITPETALPFKIEQVIGWSKFYQAIIAEKVPVVLGAFGTENKNFTNSLFTIGSQGEILSRYNKQQLVPLGEYIPFESIVGKFIDRLSPLDAHLVKGQNPVVINTPLGKATVAICYESAYPEHFRRQTVAGGTFIIISSNDAHYSPTMPAQHHALDVMQAIANSRWTVRASNTGYSGIISPTGQTIWKSQLNQYKTHTGTIYLDTYQNTYVNFGNWLVKLSVITILVFGIWPQLKIQIKHFSEE
ncbi:MAG: apolipoprotein N-acyltransferase [Limnothrix sp. RL_2_0]|nr:apolipoprotein N-acyltransferase [Limnothrix sp. RL_2_0]